MNNNKPLIDRAERSKNGEPCGAFLIGSFSRSPNKHVI